MDRRTDRAERLVAAPPARLYAALLDPDALASWLPPDGMSGRVEWFDPHPGGGYRMVLSFPPGTGAGKSGADEDVVEVRFVELVADQRIVQAVDFVAEDPAFGGTMTMTWTLTPVESGTQVEVRADDVPPGISAEDHLTGMESSLAHLAAYVEG